MSDSLKDDEITQDGIDRLLQCDSKTSHTNKSDTFSPHELDLLLNYIGHLESTISKLPLF